MHRRQMLPVFPEALALSSSDSSSSTSVSQLGNSTDQWQTSSDSQTDYSRPPTPNSLKKGLSLSKNALNHQGDVKGPTQAASRFGRPTRLASFLNMEDTRLESFLDMEDTPRPEQHFRLETLATEDRGYESEQEPDAQNGRLGAIKKTRRINRKATSARRNRRKIALESNDSEDNRCSSLDPPSKPRLVPQSLPDSDLSPILDLPPLLLPVPFMDSSPFLQQSAVPQPKDKQARTGRRRNDARSLPQAERNLDVITIEDGLSDLLGCQDADHRTCNRGRQDGYGAAKRILGLHTPPDSSEGELEDVGLRDLEMFSVAMTQLDLSGRCNDLSTHPRTDQLSSFMDLS